MFGLRRRLFPTSNNPRACFDKVPDIDFTFDAAAKNWFKCPDPSETCNEDKLFKNCKEGFFLSTTEEAKTDCVKTCPETFYGENIINKCTECTALCINCLSNSLCLKCEFWLYLDSSLKEENCVESCPEGFYASIQSGACVKCFEGCEICESKMFCTNYSEDFYLKDQMLCVSECPQGYFLPEEAEEAQARSCLICALGCSAC